MSKKQKSGIRILKTILKIFGGLFAVILVSIIGASIAIMVIVDKSFVADKMSKALNRQVSIGSVDVSVFSVLSGIEVRDVAISNFKTEKDLESLKGKPVSANDTFVGLKSFNFKVAFGPLLHKQFVLKELTLYSPVANLVRHKDGSFNFSDLMVQKPMTAEEKAKAEKEKIEAKKKAALPAEPAKPISADDIPVQITIGKVGLENGTVNLTEETTGQQISVYNTSAKVYDINIDPKNLASADQIKIKAGFGIKTVGKVSSGSVQSFDITVSLDGNIIPFDKKTRILNPEISVKAGSPSGNMTGLQIFDKMKSVGALDKYCGKLSFLNNEIRWSDAFVSAWYKDNLVKLSEGRIKTSDYAITFSGQLNTITTALLANADMTLSEKHTADVRDGIKKNSEKVITGNMKKVVTADKIADLAMKSIVNSDGKVYVQYVIKGTIAAPDANMTAPKLPDLKDLIKDAAGSALDSVKDVAGKKIDAKKDEAAKKAKSEAVKKIKKPKF